MDLLIKNVIPVGSGGICDIAVSGGVIKSVGNAPAGFMPDKVIEGGDRLAIPALVNSHTHAYMTVLRCVADDLPFADWLFKGVMPREEALTPGQAYWSSLLGLTEMIRRGCGTFCDMHMFKGASAKAALKLGMRGVIGRGLSGSEGGERRINEALAEIEEFKGEKLLNFNLAPHAIYTCDEEYLLKISDLAKKRGLPLHIHLAESEGEYNDCLNNHGCTPVEYLAKLGLFENRTLAAHCVQLTETDILLLACNGVSVAANPKSNLKLGNGIAPVARLLKAGVNVCIGTDSAASNNSLNMFSELNYTAMLHKGTELDSTAIPAKTAFGMATVNGAKALSIENLGRLEPGYKADITLVDTEAPQMQPLRDHYAALCYCCDGSEVDSVMIDGVPVYLHREFTTVDEEEIRYNVEKIYKEIG